MYAAVEFCLAVLQYAVLQGEATTQLEDAEERSASAKTNPAGAARVLAAVAEAARRRGLLAAVGECAVAVAVLCEAVASTTAEGATAEAVEVSEAQDAAARGTCSGGGGGGGEAQVLRIRGPEGRPFDDAVRAR